MNDTSVASIIRRRTLVAQPPTATVREAATMMADRGVGAVPVVQGRNLIGIFTERDILTRVVARGRSVERTRLQEVMTRRPETVATDCPIIEALDVMIVGGFRHLPVVRAGEVVGVISLRDILGRTFVLHQTRTEAGDPVEA